MTDTDCKKIFLNNECKKQISLPKQPKIIYEKINPNKYIVHIKGADKKFVLIFSETFHTNWNMYLATNKPNSLLATFLPQKNLASKHFMINGYANAWLIQPSDVNNKNDYTVIVEMTDQRIFYLSLLISFITVIVFIVGTIFFLFRR